jgi:asparagine synthase (glutamine-hydrolysing)
MCGIWFSLGFAPDPSFIDVVAHRGPDGSGWRVFDSIAGPVALGHRRLSIIDLSDAGRQPMAYADERYWIIYNGEIYNYIELRDELEAAGHQFRTQSDTEVLLAALAQWGAAALGHLVGMFAFIVWDAARAVDLCRARRVRHQAVLCFRHAPGHRLRLRDQAVHRAPGVFRPT